MVRKRLLWACALLAAIMLLSACGTSTGSSGEKIAVINWEKAVSAHPGYGKLQQGERVLRDLVAKRKSQAESANAQLGSLNKLRALRRLSEQSYLDADFSTRMVEQREIESKRLQKYSAEAEAQVDAELAPRKKAIEDSYQLKIFNLRASLETVRMKPAEREGLEKQLQDAQHERGRRVMELEKEKQQLLAAKMAPYLAESKARMDAAAVKHHQEVNAMQQSKDERDKELMTTAPKALKNILSIMDREIEKQQNKNDKLREAINKDISDAAVHLAKEKGYTIVFNKFKANLRADDITDAVVRNLPK